MLNSKALYRKNFNSDIFLQSPSTPSIIVKKIKIRESFNSLLKTKEDLFHTERNYPKENLSKSDIKHQNIYKQIYGSDIFFKNKMENIQKKKGVKIIKNRNNFSDCLEHLKNNEEFAENIKNYTLTHRKGKNEYNPDKYFSKDSATERYYSQVIDSQGSSIFLQRPFSVDPENKRNFAYNKKYLNSNLRKLNDCGADKKGKRDKNKVLTERKKYIKNKIKLYDDKREKIKRIISYKKISPQTACKINKRLNLISHVFINNIKDKQKSLENLKSKKINQKKIENYRDEYYQLGDENLKRDLTNNDPNLWGSVHSKWIRSKIDWSNSESELIFGNTFSKEMKKIYGKKGPNAFQRKVNHLADSQNKDTITERKKEPIYKIKKPPSQEKINGYIYDKIKKIVNDIPNLKEDKKNKITNNETTAVLNGENNLEKKIKGLNKYYTNANNFAADKKEKNYSEYVITYQTKGQFEKYNENDIKLMFGNKGLNIYDVQKNMFDKGIFNTIRFKIWGNEEETVKHRIDEIKKDLQKQNCRVLIDKKEKNIRKKMKNFISNPLGKKPGIMNENIGNGINNEKKLKKIPDKIRSKHNFSKEFKDINYKYKNIYTKF